MNKREVQDFYENYLENVFHGILFWAFVGASCLDWAGVLLAGQDGEDGTKAINRVAPVDLGWNIEKLLFILPVIIVVNTAIVYGRANWGKKKDGLGRKERKTLKSAQRKTELAKRLTALEVETGVGQDDR